jgi:hypothetical protein
LENTYFLLGVLTSLNLSNEQKDFITKGIIEGTIELMNSTITRENPQKRAKRFTKPHSQSKNAITKDTIQYNVLKEIQKLPARPRDFRKQLEDEEKNIDKSELSDILSTPILNNLLTRKKEKYPFRRGKPNSDLAEERRGSLSYYEKSDILQIIDTIIKDSERLKKIDDNVIHEKVFQDFIRYVYEVKKEEKEQNEIAFKNSYKTIKQKEESNNSKKEKLHKLSKNQDLISMFNNKTKTLVQKHNINLERDELNILYKNGALMFFNSLLLSQLD